MVDITTTVKRGIILYLDLVDQRIFVHLLVMMGCLFQKLGGVTALYFLRYITNGGLHFKKDIHLQVNSHPKYLDVFLISLRTFHTSFFDERIPA